MRFNIKTSQELDPSYNHFIFELRDTRSEKKTYLQISNLVFGLGDLTPEVMIHRNIFSP